MIFMCGDLSNKYFPLNPKVFVVRAGFPALRVIYLLFSKSISSCATKFVIKFRGWATSLPYLCDSLFKK